MRGVDYESTSGGLLINKDRVTQGGWTSLQTLMLRKRERRKQGEGEAGGGRGRVGKGCM